MNDKPKLIRRYFAVLSVIITTEFIFSFIVLLMLTEFSREFETVDIKNIVSVVFASLLGVFGVVDIVFFYKRIWIAFSSLRKEPIQCVVKDFVEKTYLEGNVRKYRINLLLADKDGNLYFSYGNNCLSTMKTGYVMSNNRVLAQKCMRADESIIQEGDLVDIYIHKIINSAFSLESLEKQKKGETVSTQFGHVSGGYGIKLFQGVVSP